MFTRYEYDADGRVVASVAEREPEWSRVDVEALIAFVEMGRVGPHGQPMDVAMSSEGDPANPERKWDWHVPLPSLDFAQSVLDREKESYKKQYPDANMSALRWRVVKRDR